MSEPQDSKKPAVFGDGNRIRGPFEPSLLNQEAGMPRYLNAGLMSGLGLDMFVGWLLRVPDIVLVLH